MLKNLIKTSLRYLKKHISYVILNQIGLIVGILTSIFIFLFIQNELSYDSFYPNADKIYRLESNNVNQGEVSRWAATQSAMYIYIRDRYPEIQAASRLYNWFLPIIVEYNEDIRFTENEFFFADSSFFNIFSYRLIEGDLNSALSRPENIVLTESTARKFFGEEPALGKILNTDFSNFIVTAVIEDIPKNAHFHFNMLAPMESAKAMDPNIDIARNNGIYDYLLIDNETAARNLQEKLIADAPAIYGATPDDIPDGLELGFILQPIRDIHLNGHAEKELETNGDKSLIYIFLTVGLLVLIVASINYMNLATAQSFNRAREVAVRKITGASKRHVFNQFMGESFIMVLSAVILSLLLAIALLPLLGDFIEKDLVINPFTNTALSAYLISIIVIIGFLSGSYPAFFLSAFDSLRIIKSGGGTGADKSPVLNLRRVLVVFQFTMSVILIIGAFIVYSQLKYINSKDVGFDKHDVICVDLSSREVMTDTDMLEEEMMRLNNVISAGSSFEVPGQRIQVLACRLPSEDPNNNPEETVANAEQLNVRTAIVDEGMFKSMGYRMSEGRWFSIDHPSDNPGGFIFNETAIREFGIENPLGKTVIFPFANPPIEGTLIGIVEDYNYASMHSEIEPLMMMTGNFFRYLNIRIGPDNQQETIYLIRQRWSELKPDVPFDFAFLEDIYDNMYRSERNMGIIISLFTVLAIIISAFGLFGLASYMSEKRTKEIGIRKVYGASVKSVVALLNKEFIFLVALANAFAWYPCYYYLDKWLEGFAYKTTIKLSAFVVTLGITLVLAILTVSLKTLRAARKNPVRSLKYD